MQPVPSFYSNVLILLLLSIASGICIFRNLFNCLLFNITQTVSVLSILGILKGKVKDIKLSDSGYYTGEGKKPEELTICSILTE